ncbi:MAG TPA: SRPBCC domain-containing protein, partial [Spirochaetia bacterium]|nr:SRPBCC domain-containing protein [Spirochaetia bacterium]
MAERTTNLLQNLVITRIFDAPRELVWKAWTDPRFVMQWWGPKGFTSPSCKIDLRVGGRYLFCMRAPDGQEFWSGGEYVEIIAP